MRKADNRRGILLMLICSLLWSIAGVLFKFVPWNAMVLAGGRAFFAGLTVLAYILIRGERVIVNRHTLAVGLSMALCCTLFVIGNKLTTAANAIVLQFTAPVFLLVFSAIFFKARFARRDVIAVILTLCGIALFFFDRLDAGHMLGNIISVASGASMALMYIAMDRGEQSERFSGILLCECFTLLWSLPFFFIDPPAVSLRPVLVVVILGVVQLGIPYILMSYAASDCPPLALSLLSALEPLLNPVWVLLFYGERPGVFAIIGGAAVIVTITVWCIVRDRAEAES